MKILHLFDHSLPLHSGYTFRSRSIIRCQRALGWETVHVTSAKHPPMDAPSEEADGLTFYRTPKVTGTLAGLPGLSELAMIDAAARRLMTIAEQEKPDILHAHSPALNGVSALRVSQRLNIPLVYEIRAFWEDAAVSHGTATEWGPRYRLTRAMETYVARRAHGLTCICEGLRGDLIARGIPAERITVIPNAVDIEKFPMLEGGRDEALAAELGVGPGPVIGFIGSFYEYEGLDILLRGAALLRDRYPDLRVLLVGGGQAREALEALAAELGIAERVLFSGRVPHDQVSRYYALIDVLAYPRTKIRLTDLVTPLKPLEAMAQGKMQVASDVGGHRELIRDGDTGFLFKADDPADMARATGDLLDRRDDWPDIARRARTFVETERTWERSVSNYKPLFEYLTGGPRRR
ncbi:MAG: glycosyltransferase, exosortase A system-associated [Rhodobacterales bacterium]|nr:glycosyltransferase, exosortase A system-associated [Rhodobacterales bacterium]